MESWVAKETKGRWSLRAIQREVGELALHLIEREERAARPQSGPVSLAGQTAWLKIDRLRGRASFRHGLRALAGRPAPRLREFENLLWLADHQFEAVEPLAAGALLRSGLPTLQFLFTRRVAEAPTLLEYLEASRATLERSTLIEGFGAELARLHGLGFIHHDLFLRNLLVRNDAGQRRLVFLDAWRGGPAPQWRGPDYDLACFLLEGADLLDADEQRCFFESYFRAHASLEGTTRARFLERVLRQRGRLLRRLEEQPGRRRGRPLPSAAWDPHSLGFDPTRIS